MEGLFFRILAYFISKNFYILESSECQNKTVISTVYFI